MLHMKMLLATTIEEMKNSSDSWEGICLALRLLSTTVELL